MHPFLSEESVSAHAFHPVRSWMKDLQSKGVATNSLMRVLKEASDQRMPPLKATANFGRRWVLDLVLAVVVLFSACDVDDSCTSR